MEFEFAVRISVEQIPGRKYISSDDLTQRIRAELLGALEGDILEEIISGHRVTDVETWPRAGCE